MSELAKPLKNALHTIGAYGFAVIPVHGVGEFTGCTCGNAKCASPGKHPTIGDWPKRATKDKASAVALFEGVNDDYNYGIATGPESGIFIVDIDGADGEESLLELQTVHGPLPSTLTAITGKGRHLFFEYPGKKVHGRASKIGKNIDIRGDGGMVVGAGSRHVSGRMYDWWVPIHPIVAAPEWLIELVCKEQVERKVEPVGLNFDAARAKLHLHDRKEFTADDIAGMLKFIDPDRSYDDWYQIGMALKDYGLPFSLWDDWSRGGQKYVAGEPSHKWNSFKGTGVSIGTVVHFAKLGGWQPAGYNHNQYKDFAQKIYDEPAGLKDEFDAETGEFYEEKPQAEQPNSDYAGRILPLIYADDITAITETNDFIEGLLCDQQFSVIYGASNCGKTFFMLDLAMHVALGQRWRGRDVEQGAVLYCALEGGTGTRNRIAAFKQHFKTEVKVPLVVIPSNLNFMDAEGDIMSLVYAIKQAQQRIGNIRLIVIDTLARAMSGGDENSSMDMGRMVINADLIRSVTGAHIAFIHHSGKDDLKGARGHSSLRAAVDTEIEISRVDEHSPSQIKVVKQREMEMIEDQSFMLERVVLGHNHRQKEVTSCVVIAIEHEDKGKPVKLSDIQSFIFDALVGALINHGQRRTIAKYMPPVDCVSYDELREELEARGYKNFMATESKTTAQQIKSATQSARVSLKKRGKINFNNNYVWLAENVGMKEGMQE